MPDTHSEFLEVALKIPCDLLAVHHFLSAHKLPVQYLVTNFASPPLILSSFAIRMTFVYLHQPPSRRLHDLMPPEACDIADGSFPGCGMSLTWAWSQSSFKG